MLKWRNGNLHIAKSQFKHNAEMFIIVDKCFSLIVSLHSFNVSNC